MSIFPVLTCWMFFALGSKTLIFDVLRLFTYYLNLKMRGFNAKYEHWLMIAFLCYQTQSETIYWYLLHYSCRNYYTIKKKITWLYIVHIKSVSRSLFTCYSQKCVIIIAEASSCSCDVFCLKQLKCLSGIRCMYG